MKIRIVYFTIFITIISCVRSQEKETKFLSNNDSLVDKSKSFIDTSIYKKHKSGFYVTKTGDIYQLHCAKLFDTNGEDELSYWLDTLIFYREYPNRVALKKVIDLNSFENLDSSSYFNKDKNHVYYTRYTTNGNDLFVIDNANSKTFKVLSGRWAKDDKHVFYNSNIVDDADVKSFKMLNERDSARDKNHLFVNGEMIQ